MKVFLRLARVELYYAGSGFWARDAERAFDLETIERATELGRDEDLESMEIVVSFGDPSCDFVLPLRRRGGGRVGAESPSVPGPLSPVAA